MKLTALSNSDKGISVTPFVGVWIETPVNSQSILYIGVTPFVGVWIETCGMTL